VPTRRQETNTLVFKLDAYVKHVGGGQGAFTVHRLDRGVSGLLVFAKSQEVVRLLKDQFAASKPEREYVAIVAGFLQPKEGTFQSLLATDKDLNRFSTDDEKIGQLAITHFASSRIWTTLRSCRSGWKPAAATRSASTSPKPATPFSATSATNPNSPPIPAGPTSASPSTPASSASSTPSPTSRYGSSRRCRANCRSF
jgi:hypothetical protein